MNRTKISAKVVADSIDSRGNRLTSLLVTFPRIILAEINTHRMLSKNTSSSRAIPFKKMVESVQNDTFIPIAWQKEHTGMQGYEYFTDSEMTLPDGDKFQENCWLIARDKAIEQAKYLSEAKVTKQLCNRLLEPFMWTTMLITGSKEGWENFFELRNPVYEVGHNTFKSKKEVLDYYSDDPNFPELRRYSDLDWLKLNRGQAEIHMMDLAEKIYDAMNESTPKQLQGGEWHIPFEDKIDLIDWLDTVNDDGHLDGDLDEQDRLFEIDKVKISTAMAAHTSYTTVGNEPVKSYDKWIDLHDKLINEEPPHSSPLEHASQAMTDEEYYLFSKGKDGQKDHEHGWCGPYKGFKSYRYLLEVEDLKL